MELCADAVSAGYGDRNILSNVTFALQTGEFVGLIGPNGAGKSTLIRALAGVLPARSGRVMLDGGDLRRLGRTGIARRIAVVPQSETPAFEFTVRDVVAMGRYSRRSRTPRERAEDRTAVEDALRDADLQALADRPVTRLSGGEHRRVLLARALAQHAPLLLLDEPTAHLDLGHEAEVLGLVRMLVTSGRLGALAALHDLNRAAEYCDRLVLLVDGGILAEGPPERVLTRDNLRRAYSAETRLGRNPATGKPLLLDVLPSRAASTHARSVHVICGGGSGAGVMAELLRCGCRVTAGVLNEGDSDHEAALAMGIEVAAEAPFCGISPSALDHARTMAAGADVVVVAAAPFGPGNVANLRLAVEAQGRGAETVLLFAGDDALRDYSGGCASALLAELRAAGAGTFASVREWISAAGADSDVAA